jgi:hypothetical protein
MLFHFTMSSGSTVTPVLYDETYRGRQTLNMRVETVHDVPNLIGYLEHHAPDTDGSFAICVAGGTATLVNKVGKERRRLAEDLLR